MTKGGLLLPLHLGTPKSVLCHLVLHLDDSSPQPVQLLNPFDGLEAPHTLHHCRLVAADVAGLVDNSRVEAHQQLPLHLLVH